MNFDKEWIARVFFYLVVEGGGGGGGGKREKELFLKEKQVFPHPLPFPSILKFMKGHNSVQKFKMTKLLSGNNFLTKIFKGA